jgi:hypothetical protein
VVEELAEQGHHAVERRGQADVGRQIRNEVGIMVKDDLVLSWISALLGTLLRRRRGGRVACALVHDQVADRARRRIVHHISWRRLRVAGRSGRRAGKRHGLAFGGHEFRRYQARHDFIGSATTFHARQQIIPRAVDGAQPVRKQRTADQIRQVLHLAVGSDTGFGDLDLLEDEVQVIHVDIESILQCSRSHFCSP